jgi:hypothetical protein
MYFKLNVEIAGGTLGFKFGRVPGIFPSFSFKIARKYGRETPQMQAATKIYQGRPSS